MELKDLHAHPQNPRKITDKKLTMLKKSLEAFGDLGGIIFNRRTKHLIGGHQRLKVLPPTAKITISKKYDEPTTQGTTALGHLEHKGEKFSYREVDVDEPTEKAMNIAANQHGGDFDMAILPDWINEIDTFNIDMDLLGFDPEELESMMTPTFGGGLTDEDSVPEVPDEPTSKLGDLYQLGNHRLLCGDSTDILQVEKLMNGEKADMVFTDPPYGINESAAKRGSRETNSLAKSNKHLKEFIDDSTQYAIDAFNLCQTLEIPVQVWFGANYYCHDLPQTNNWLVWDKRLEEKQTDNNSDAELAWIQDGRSSTRIFRHLWKGLIKGSEHGERRVHPTQKPVALAEWCLLKYEASKSCLDLFGGSGSTLIACEKTNRKCFMMELDPHYCDIIVARWEKFTGKKAELQKTILRKSNGKKAKG